MCFPHLTTKTAYTYVWMIHRKVQTKNRTHASTIAHAFRWQMQCPETQLVIMFTPCTRWAGSWRCEQRKQLFVLGRQWCVSWTRTAIIIIIIQCDLNFAANNERKTEEAFTSAACSTIHGNNNKHLGVSSQKVAGTSLKTPKRTRLSIRTHPFLCVFAAHHRLICLVLCGAANECIFLHVDTIVVVIYDAKILKIAGASRSVNALSHCADIISRLPTPKCLEYTLHS